MPLLPHRVPALRAALAGCALFLAATLGAQPFWRQADIRGMGFVTGVVVHPLDGSTYIRTDVGGAYKWDAPAARWVALLDNKSVPDDPAYYDVESLTLDPQNPARLFAAVGTGTASDTYLIRSQDGGSTWERLAKPPTLAVRANDHWRWAGERFQVDPNNPAVLYYGSRSVGLWRCLDGTSAASSVTRNQVPTTQVPAGDHGGYVDRGGRAHAGGVTFVAIDPRATQTINGRSRTVYAGVMGGGVYQSDDGGDTFAKISTAAIDIPDANGNPRLNPIQGRVADDGALYVTFSRDDDVHGMPLGMIWRRETDGTWTRLDTNMTDWTRGNQRWTGIAISGDRLLAISDGNVPLTYAYSANRGATWRNVGMDPGYSPYLDHTRPAWWPSNPYDLCTFAGGCAFAGPASREVWITTGWGVHRVVDVLPASGRALMDTHGAMKGVEELIYTHVAALPAANNVTRLVALGMDMGAFILADIDKPPTLPDADIQNTNGTGFGYCHRDPRRLAVVGGQYATGAPKNFLSADGGATWAPLNPPFAGAQGGNIAIASNDPDLMVWAPLNQQPQLTRDAGRTWTPIAGLPVWTNALSSIWNSSQVLAADTAADNTFYYYEDLYGYQTRAKLYRVVVNPSGATPACTVTMVNNSALPGGWKSCLSAAPGVAGELWFRPVADSPNATSTLRYSTDGGVNWTEIPGLTHVRAFAVGPALPGGNTPVVYAAGTRDGAEGLYYSTDRGARWSRVQLGGAQLPFSRISSLAADLREPGRLHVATAARGIFSATVISTPSPGTTATLATGFTRLQAELGAGALATGAGLVPAQIEATLTTGGTDFAPDATRPALAGRNFVLSPATGTPSSHASMVGELLYGTGTSFSPGASDVLVYNANTWLTTALGLGTANLPSAEGAAVLNHSWIGAFSGQNAAATAETAYLRLDHLADRSGALVVAGMNNGASPTLPDLLGQGYNLVSVGRSDGQHSAGLTTLAGADRVKPDLVAPAGTTSEATPMVASAGLLLRATAAADSALSPATDPRALKALLLATASRYKFSTWAQTATRPLDLVYGAGELNVYHAHRLLTAGRRAASTSTVHPARGWDFNTTTNNPNGRRYFFDVPAGNTRSRFAAALVWHRAVSDTLVATLPDLTLRMHAATDTTLGALLAESASPRDNLELLHLPALAPGRYALVVPAAAGATAYALAWFSVPTVTLTAGATGDRLRDGSVVTLTFTRAGGDPALPLRLPLAIAGGAVSGTHYSPAPPAELAFTSGQTTATLDLTLLPAADPAAPAAGLTVSLADDFASAPDPAQNTVALTLHARPFGLWGAARFSSAQLADAAISGPSADPDADGLSNLLEYALAREPLVADAPATALPAVGTDAEGRLTLTYVRPADRPDLAYAVEWTDNLAAGTWSTSADRVVELLPVTVAGGQQITARATAPLATSPRQFLRLRVTRL